MTTVTQRIKNIIQPRGGYLDPKSFKFVSIKDSYGALITEGENVHSSIAGLAVDYLSRAILSKNPQNAFKISIMGARLLGKTDNAIKMAESVKNLSSDTIITGCKLAGYDVAYRAGPSWYKPIENICPDENTIEHIRVMVERSLDFFKTYGPVIADGFTFEGGYTEIITKGDGDFITQDSLWDFKVSKAKPTKDHTLQLLIYYLMGKHSIHKEFQSVKRLGIFNPRLGEIYIKNIADIGQNIIHAVSQDVIGY